MIISLTLQLSTPLSESQSCLETINVLVKCHLYYFSVGEINFRFRNKSQGNGDWSGELTRLTECHKLT